jgi:hypothetical protein
MTIRTSADLLALWTRLVPSAERRRRTLWLAFLDSHGRTLPTAMPIDDLPAEPDALLCRNLGKILADLVSSGHAHSGLLLLVRPGSDAATASDRRWAAMLRDAVGTELCRWPVHLATPAGTQSLEADGLSAAS